MGSHRSVLLARWSLENNVWKGEIDLVYIQKTSAHYSASGFDSIYKAWVLRTKSQEDNLIDGPTGASALESKFQAIDREFKYYRDELVGLFEQLDTEKKERFRKILIELEKQYDLLSNGLNSEEDISIFLDFLKELPGRMRFIMLTLVAKETEVFEPSQYRFTEKWDFPKGKAYGGLEETGCGQSLFFMSPHTREVR